MANEQGQGGIKSMRGKNDGVLKECSNCKCSRYTKCGCKKRKKD